MRSVSKYDTLTENVILLLDALFSKVNRQILDNIQRWSGHNVPKLLGTNTPSRMYPAVSK